KDYQSNNKDDPKPDGKRALKVQDEIDSVIQSLKFIIDAYSLLKLPLKLRLFVGKNYKTYSFVSPVILGITTFGILGTQNFMNLLIALRLKKI
ncbi:MAG: hypothetical protein MUP24_10315, partial [Gillisia sp.]|nr:hypothetical protein [Gillisia sp.]